MSVRLFHKGARLAVVVRRSEGAHESRHRWLGLHRSPHDWAHIFVAALSVLDLKDPAAASAARQTGLWSAAGVELRWTVQRYWTTIDLRLAQGSLRKRQLIAATLLKAARYQTF